MLPETIGRSVCYHYSTPVAVWSSRFLLVIPSTIGSIDNESRFSIFSEGWGWSFFHPRLEPSRSKPTRYFSIAASLMDSTYYSQSIGPGFTSTYWFRQSQSSIFWWSFAAIPTWPWTIFTCSRWNPWLDNERTSTYAFEYSGFNQQDNGRPRHLTFSFTSSWS